MTDLAACLSSWHPEPLVEHDDMGSAEASHFAALLDSPPPDSGLLPPLWHWFHFLTWPAQRHIGLDGHPVNGHFLPPIPERRRMFAGGRVTVERPLELEVPADRHVSLAKAVVKQGRSGEMAFVTVRSEYRQNGELSVVEDQDYVYRSGDGPARSFTTPTGELPEATWQSTPTVDETLLFRFSAITANSHRIHYDAPYTRNIEGYPGLVVHGPLLVLLMLELVCDRDVASVEYRLQHPVFLGDSFRVIGEPAGDLAVVSPGGTTNAVARVRFQ
ncbi:MAG: hypothetical protein LLG14_05050 [Nocardiaceae bacterium]|nr:hypothetical protein [Nocardiaceae bacterium]